MINKVNLSPKTTQICYLSTNRLVVTHTDGSTFTMQQVLALKEKQLIGKGWKILNSWL